MASLEDEEQIRRLTAAYGDNELVVRTLTEGLRELNSATGKLSDEDKRRAAAAVKANAALGSLADAFITYNKEIYKGRSAAEASAATMDKLGDAAIQAAAGLAVLAPGGLAVKALIAGIGLFVSKLASAGKEITLQTGTIYKSFQELSKVGATGAQGMQGVFDSLMKVGLGTEKFGEYIKLISENAQDLATIGGTVKKGSDLYTESMAELTDAQRIQMEVLVGDRQAQAEAVMGYIKQQKLLTAGTKQQMDTSSAAVMRYIKETDELTRLTGLNRKEQEKQNEDAMRNEVFMATVNEVRLKEGDKAADNLMTMNKMLAAFPQQQKAFQSGVGGFIGASEEASSQFFLTGGVVQEVGEAFRSGMVKTNEDVVEQFKKLGAATGKGAEGFTNLAKMGAFNRGVGLDYAEAIKLAQRATLISVKDVSEAQADQTGALEAGAKMAKAENDVRETQLAQQKALNLGMGLAIEGMETAAESNRILAESALEAARALDKISKRKGEPKKPLAQAKKELESATDTAAADAERAKQLEADKNATRADKERAKAKADSSAAAVAQAIRDQRESELAERNARQAEARRARAEKLMGKTPAAPTAPAAAGGAAAPSAPAAPTAPAAPSAAAGQSVPAKPIEKIVDTRPGELTVGTPDGDKQKRIGTAAWRNNNPGNLRGAGTFITQMPGYVGEADAGSSGWFSVFKTKADGDKAKEELLFSGRSKIYTPETTIRDAMFRYAPPSENKTEEYLNAVVAAIGVPDSTKIKDLTSGQKTSWLNAISKHEGNREGTVVQAADGGVFNGPKTGYPATLHGNEAVIPLKNGAVPVHLDSTPTFAGYNEYKGYNQGPMSTDLKALEQIAGKLGAYDAATKTITDPKVWKEILNSGMLMNYNLAGVETGTKMLGPDVGNIIGDRINEVIKNNQTDTGSAIAAVRQEFSDAMTKLIDYMKAQNSDSGLQEEMLTTLKEISRTNASAASASEKMLLYAQN